MRTQIACVFTSINNMFNFNKNLHNFYNVTLQCLILIHNKFIHFIKFIFKSYIDDNFLNLVFQSKSVIGFSF